MDCSGDYSSEDYLAELNQSQREAVRHIDGPLLVLAGPGSGKTRVITYRIAHMIAQGVRPGEIIALTFTNKAAGEMRQRLDRLVGPSDVWLGTFHGFCVRLLRRYASLVGLPENFSIYDVDDAAACLKAAVAKSNFELTHVPLGALATRISFFKNRLITPEILESEALSSEEYQVGQVYPHYQQELLRCGAVDFDDILLHVATLLRSNPELRAQLDARFRYCMVDEYQDTNLAQYVIVRHLNVDNPNLAATGDPDQSIYGWRGANVKNVSNLERDYSDLRVIRLEDNYRSTPEILAAADHLIQNNEYRKQKSLIAARPSGNSVRLAVYPTARMEAEDLADQIQAHMAEGDLEPRDFGVLYRTNSQSRLVEQALLRRQIPYQLIGGFRFYMRKEIKDLVSYLLLIHNPDDDIALSRCINTPARGVGKKSLEDVGRYATKNGLSMLEACRQCVQFAIISKRAAKAIGQFLKIYDQLCSIVHGPLLDLLESTVELTGYRAYLATQAEKNTGGNDVEANLDELLAEASEIDSETPPGQSPLEAFLEFAALEAATDKLESAANSVTLMTLHAAKGLEFKHVYLIAVEENILPHSRSKDDPLQLEEERRLLFVGITRAQDQLQLSYAKSRGFSGSGSGVPSSFLLELPRSEMEFIDRTEFAGGFDGGFPASGDGDAPYDPNLSSSNVDWDSEMSQVDSDDEVFVDFDDDCQLPPEEMAARLRKRKLSGAAAAAGIRLASEMVDDVPEADDQWSDVSEGCTVRHPHFGQGTVLSISGTGKKKSATIGFEMDSSVRTFRLSHVKLTVE